MINRSKDLHAARRAFHAVDAAIQKAEVALKQLKKSRATQGSTVMVRRSTVCGHDVVTCSHCGNRELANSVEKKWRYCPHCGSEIIRFDSENEMHEAEVAVSIEREEPVDLGTIDVRIEPRP